jgi:hypothetical protein
MALKATPPRNTRTKSNDAITGDDVTRLNAEKLQRQKDAKPEEKPETKDAPEEKEQSSTITKSQFDQLTAAIQVGADAAAKLKVVEQELADAKAALEAKDAAVDVEKETLKADADKKGEELDFVEKLFTQLGHPNPVDGSNRFSSQALVVGAKMDAATALREFESMHKDANRKYWSNENTGEQFEHVDTAKLDRFIRLNREEVRDGMEALAKKNGLLRGKDAATTRADIPQAYLTYLSALMRITHSSKFIFWQFVNAKIEMGKGMGDTVQIPRVDYANAGTTVSDWELTPGTPIVTTSQRVAMSNVSATLKEYGMGKVGSANEPIAIPEFILANSQIELEGIVQKNLGYNYWQYEESGSRSMWFASTKTLYNNQGTPVATAAAALATAATAKYRSGTCTYQFLINLYAFLSGQKVPSYDQNGCYGLVLHEFALAQLKADLKANNQYFDTANLEEITNIFRATTMSDMVRISGYQGTIANFMIFSTNNISMDAVGTIGVQTETVASVAQTTRTSFAFGSGSIGRGIGMNAQIRRQTEDDFARMNRWLWVAHEGWVALDVDNAAAGQQTRVFKINTTETEV